MCSRIELPRICRYHEAGDLDHGKARGCHVPIGRAVAPASERPSRWTHTRSPVTESKATLVAGKSGNAVAPDPSRFVQVAVPGPGLYLTEKMCPGVVGVSEL